MELGVNKYFWVVIRESVEVEVESLGVSDLDEFIKVSSSVSSPSLTSLLV